MTEEERYKALHMIDDLHGDNKPTGNRKQQFSLPDNGFGNKDTITDIKLNNIPVCSEPALGDNDKASTENRSWLRKILQLGKQHKLTAHAILDIMEVKTLGHANVMLASEREKNKSPQEIMDAFCSLYVRIPSAEAAASKLRDMKIGDNEELAQYCARLSLTSLDAYKSYPEGSREEMMDLACSSNLLLNVHPVIKNQIQSRNDHRRLVGLNSLNFHEMVEEIMKLQERRSYRDIRGNEITGNPGNTMNWKRNANFQPNRPTDRRFQTEYPNRLNRTQPPAQNDPKQVNHISQAYYQEVNQPNREQYNYEEPDDQSMSEFYDNEYDLEEINMVQMGYNNGSYPQGQSRRRNYQPLTQAPV